VLKIQYLLYAQKEHNNYIQHHWIDDIYTIDYLSAVKTNKIAAILAFEKNKIYITIREHYELWKLYNR